jgi:uncharacterized protein Yka (UPF0111/DUF47 family)
MSSRASRAESSAVSMTLSPKSFWAAFADHARHTATAARFLVEMLEDFEQQGPGAQAIRKLELRASDISRQMLVALEHATIAPLDAKESHALILELSGMLVELRSVSDRVALHHMHRTLPDVVELARILASSVDKVLEAVNMLILVSNQEPLADLCRAIGAHKHRAERVLRGAMAELFRDVSDPIEIVKWLDILAALEAATSSADGVARVIEGISIARV